METTRRTLHSSRPLVLLALGAVVTTVVLAAWPERALASLMLPSWMRQRSVGPHTSATPSPDGRWIAIELRVVEDHTGSVRIVETASGSSRTVDLPNPSCMPVAWSADGLLRVRTQAEDQLVHWIDPSTMKTVRTTPDKDWYEQGLADRSRDGWSRRSQARDDGNGQFDVFTWTDRGVELRLPSSPLHGYQTTRKPGVVIEVITQADARLVRAHDVASGGVRELARLERWTSVWASPDGEQLLVTSCAGRAARSGLERAQILDADDGTLLDEFDAPGWCIWRGEGHRWIQAERDGRSLLHDRERGTTIDVGANDDLPRVQPLPDGQILVQCDDDIGLHDATTGALVRRF